MATFKRDCAGCSRRFTAKASNAKWCGAACKKRAQRVGRAEAKKATEDSPLVDRLRVELGEAADTLDGMLALELAARIAKTGATSTLVRELRVVKAAALGEPSPTDGKSGDDGDEDDEPGAADPGMALVLAMEERRDSKRADAAATG